MNARQAWAYLLKQVRNGRKYIDQDNRECIEQNNLLLTVDDSSDAISLVREMQQQSAWVYPTPEELKTVILGASQGAYEYSYVPRLFGAINQIDKYIVPLLKQNPQTRRAVAVVYHPEDSKLSSKNVPGLICIQFRLIEKLEMTYFIRSNDAFIGFPADLYQLRCLQEYVCEQVGCEPGKIYVFSGSAHFFPEYEEQYQSMTKAINKDSAGQTHAR